MAAIVYLRVYHEAGHFHKVKLRAVPKEIQKAVAPGKLRAEQHRLLQEKIGFRYGAHEVLGTVRTGCRP
jgi:hypothetical protein